MYLLFSHSMACDCQRKFMRCLGRSSNRCL
nr:MAG TPA: hypothetical protein [Caudoviricetes sp.]